MADYDQGMDLVGEVHDKMFEHLASDWKPGEGTARGNEYNCSNAENMAYAIERLGLHTAYVDSKFIPFLKDVLEDLEDGINLYSRKNHPWRKAAVEHVKMLRKMIEEE